MTKTQKLNGLNGTGYKAWALRYGANGVRRGRIDHGTGGVETTLTARDGSDWGSRVVTTDGKVTYRLPRLS